MDLEDVAYIRLASQHISSTEWRTPQQAVFSLGAVQAQDYQAALWAIAMRCQDVTKKDVEEAIAKKQIVRSWPLRHTLHFVSPDSVRWMLEFYRDEPIPAYQRNNGLTEPILEKGLEIVSKAFDKKKQLTYKEMHKALENTGIKALDNSEVQAHIIRRAGRDGIICFGSHEGKLPTFTLLEQWVPKSKVINHQDALTSIAQTYFKSHGPATIKDFVWWSGLKMSDARAGIEKASAKLRREQVGETLYYMGKDVRRVKMPDSSAYLLAGFDEYIIGYSDRSAMLSNEQTREMLKSGKIVFTYSNGIFLPTIVVEGQVVGSWKSITERGKVQIKLNRFSKIDGEHLSQINEAAEAYGRFLGVEVKLSQ